METGEYDAYTWANDEDLESATKTEKVWTIEFQGECLQDPVQLAASSLTKLLTLLKKHEWQMTGTRTTE
jgi:hypothetical protein